MLYRWIHRVYRINAAATRWFRRRLTPAGYFVLVGLMLFAAAANSEQTVALQAFFFLVSMVLFAVLSAPFFRLKARIERQPPRFVTIDEPFSVRVRVTNLTQKKQAGLQYLEDLQEAPVSAATFAAHLPLRRISNKIRIQSPPPPLHGARTQTVPIPTLPPKGFADLSVEITARRRGPLILRGAYVGRPDPLGLFRALVRIEEPRTTLVLPKRYPLPPIDLPGKSQYQQDGIAMASGIGEAEEFVALRDYRRGDSLRRVHWRSTARLGKLVVKEFQDEYLVRHALVLDTFCKVAQDGRFEEAVAVAASFACTVPDQESLLDLMFVGPSTVCVTSGRGVGQPEQLLEVLAAVKPCREPRFDDLESLILQHHAALGGAILVLLDWDEPRMALIRQLRALHLPTLVLLMSPKLSTDPIALSDPADRPDRWALLETGSIAEDLQQLGNNP